MTVPRRPPVTPPSREALVTYGLPTLLALLVMSGATWFVFRHVPVTRRETVAAIAANLEQRLTTRQAAIETWLDEYFQDASVVAAFPTVRSELLVPYRPGRRRNAHLDEILVSTSGAEHIEAIAIVDPALRMIAGTHPRLDTAAHAVARSSLARRGHAADFAVFAGGYPRLVIAVPVMGEQTTVPIGAVVLTVDPARWLYPFLTASPVAESSGEAFLLRQEGDSVLFLSPLRLHPVPPMRYRLSLEAPTLAAHAALSDGMHFGEFTDYRGVAIFAATARIAGSSWGLVVKVDQADALAGWRQRMWTTALTEGGLLLLLTLLVIAFWWGLQTSHQAAVARDRAHLATLLDQASDAIIFVELDGRIRDANRRAHELYGFPGGGLIGRSAIELRPPELHEAARAQLRKALKRDVVTFRTIHVTAAGRQVPVEVSSRKVRVGDDEVFVSVIRDISERQAAEARILRLNAMLRTLSELSELMVHGESADRVMADACRIAVEHGGFRLAWVGAPEPDGRVRVLAAAGTTAYLDGIAVRWDDTPQGRGPTGIALREHRTVTIADLQTEPAFAPWRERAQAHNLRSSASTPIRQGGVVTAVLMLYAETPDFFDAESTALLEELAGDLGFALRSLEERAALRETAEKLGAFFHSPAIGMLFGDVHGRIIDANDELLRIVGYDRADMTSGVLRWDAITPPEFLPLDAERIAEAVREGVCTPYEKQYIRKDGSRIWVMVGFALLGEARELSVAYILDISAKKKVEAALQESERRFRLVVEGAPVGILVHAGGTIRYLNETACELFGVADYAALIGTRVIDRVHPDDREVVIRRITALVEGVNAPPAEERLLRLDGSTFLAEVEAVPLSHDAVPGAMVFFRDITAHKVAQEEQALVTAALEQSAEVAMITDTDGTILYVNPAFERVTGYTRAEAVGRNPRVLKSGRQDPRFYERMWKVLTAGDVFADTIVNRRKDGQLYVAEMVISPVRDGTGKVTRYLGLQRDVTREHELEDQLRQSQKMEAVGQLTGGIAHDFNNLLGVILANAAVLRRDLPAERGDLFAFVDDLMDAATRGGAMVRKLLAFSRRERLAPAPMDVVRTLHDTTRTLRRFLPETIRMETRAEGTLTATVDAAALDQIMLNLATNARDAMPAGGTFTIAAEAVELEAGMAGADSPPGRYICVAVSDTGHGMDQQTLAHAFEPFFTTKPAGSGTGLGLAMVFGLMRQHGGFVRLDSERGNGTTVRLYFRATRHTPAAAAPTEAATPAATTAPAAGGTILVVEDQEPLRRATARALNRLGYEVVLASDAAEAFAVIAERGDEIALVLTDVVMPGLSGVDLYRRLRAEGMTTPVLLMSGYPAGSGEAQDVPDDMPLILKPWTIEALDARVRQLLADGPGR
jgi:PAS domain S-box-containing protein